MHIFIAQKAFDTLFDTVFESGQNEKTLKQQIICRFYGNIACFFAFFDVNFDTDFTSGLSMQPMHCN